MAVKWGQNVGPKWGQGEGPKWGQQAAPLTFLLFNWSHEREMKLAITRLNQSSINTLKESLPSLILSPNKMIFLIPEMITTNISLDNGPTGLNASAPSKMENTGEVFVSGKLGRFKAENR